MSGAAMVGIEPLGWPPTAGNPTRQVAWMLHGLAVELEALWGALELARRLRDEHVSGDIDRLAQQLSAVASAAVPVGQDSAHLASMLDAEVLQAGAHLREASERRREVLTVVRGWMRLARHGLLDQARVGPGLAGVIDELAAAGQAVVAADAALLACVRVPKAVVERE